MQLPRLIGITGKAGAGKDTIADFLVRYYDYHRYAFADPIKRLLNERFALDPSIWDDRDRKERAAPQFGFAEGRHKPFSPRSWMQWLGTEVGRKILGENVWVDQMEQEWHRLNATTETIFRNVRRMVVPDVRFDNEAQRIRALGGVILQVKRWNTPLTQQHVSEDGINPELVDYFVENDGDIKWLQSLAIQALSSFNERLAA